MPSHDNPGFMDRRLSAVMITALLALGGTFGFVSCCDYGRPAETAATSAKPALRIYALGAAAGAIEPCGCVKDMLGGVDHLAAWIAKEERAAGAQLLLAAGPLFVADPKVPDAERQQRIMKAETMAEALGTMQLSAFAPGVNDFALGNSDFGRFVQRTHALPLAANYAGKEGLRGHAVVESGGIRVGLVGVAELSDATTLGDKSADALAALRASAAQAKKEGAKVLVALIAMPRGEALRLIEQTSDFQVAIIGKNIEAGEHNDPPFPPEIIGQTLVVQAPNHVQGVGVIDLFVKDGSYRFEDGTGLRRQEELGRARQRLEDLSVRLKRAEAPGSGVAASDVSSLRRQIDALGAQVSAMETESPQVPQDKSYFKYAYVEVRESHGSSEVVQAKLSDYYKRVNDHNKVAFADRKPPPAEPGASTYLGVERCASCHEEEHRFWKTTQHAHAYATLADMHKEYNLDCVSCHVTGYERPSGSTVTHVAGLTDVQCEVCHGPGSKHAESPLDKALLSFPTPSLCADTCHHPPHVGATWKATEAWPKILGPGHGMPSAASAPQE